MTPRMRGTNILIIVLTLFFMFASYQWFLQTGVKKMTYSEFLTAIEAGNVTLVNIHKSDGTAFGTLKDKTKIKVVLPPDIAPLLDRLQKENVPFSIEPPGLWQWLTPSIVTVAIFALPIILFYFFIARQMQSSGTGQAFTFGRSRARLYSEMRNRITFKDVAGVDEAKEELSEIVEFLQDPQKFTILGAKIPKGILLVGPPGCGKTLLARAVAGEAKVNFFYISGSDFVEMFVGVGAARVRDLFDQAKKSPPCVIFVDELDAVGRHRGSGLGGGHDEREQTLNQLLVEMDGFEPNSGVILLAATNRPDVLDPALLRAGRFDRQVVVDRPDLRGRVEIFRIHTRNKPLASEIDMEILARRTPGFSGADIENAANEGAILAARRNRKAITMDDFEEAIDKVIAGPERKSRLISDKEKAIIAYHELGHAIVAYNLPNSDPVHRISILPRGMALGYTLQIPIGDKFIASRSEILDKLCVLLGGRASEEIIFNDITTGAANDLRQSTEITRAMVTEYGMSEKLGPITFGRKHDTIFLGRDIYEDRNYSEEIANVIDEEVRGIVQTCFERAKKILLDSKGILDKMAETLMEKESLDRNEFESLMKTLAASTAPA